VLRAEGHFGLVDLDKVLQEAPIGVDHRAPELLQKQPCCLVAAEAQLRLELERRDPVGVARHDMRGQEPGPQWQMAAMHDRARGHRSLPSAA